MSHNNWLLFELDDKTRENLHGIAEYTKINSDTIFGENISFEPMKYNGRGGLRILRCFLRYEISIL